MAYFAAYTMCGALDAADCDAHAVYGIGTKDGGYALVGKWIASGEAIGGYEENQGKRENQGGFVLKQSGDPRLLGLAKGQNAIIDNPDNGYSQAGTWTGEHRAKFVHAICSAHSEYLRSFF